MNTQEGFVRLTFDIQKEAHKALKMIAAQRGESMVNVIRRAINRELGYMTRKQQEE